MREPMRYTDKAACPDGEQAAGNQRLTGSGKASYLSKSAHSLYPPLSCNTRQQSGKTATNQSNSREAQPNTAPHPHTVHQRPRPAQITPVTVSTAVPGVTIHAPVAISCTTVAAGTVITLGTVAKAPVAAL